MSPFDAVQVDKTLGELNYSQWRILNDRPSFHAYAEGLLIDLMDLNGVLFVHLLLLCNNLFIFPRDEKFPSKNQA
jgi:hypothetical protein